MKKQTSGALAIGVVVVVVAALLAIFNQSRTFAQTMGQDYDPGQVQAIHVALYAPDDAQSRQVTLSPTDPAAQELLTLLGSQMYDVVYSFGTVSGGYSAPYGYLANLAIRLPEKGTGYSWASITLSGGAPAADLRPLPAGLPNIPGRSRRAEGDHGPAVGPTL